jgi:phenylalanyl-tRNA synthetase alpha chain
MHMSRHFIHASPAFPSALQDIAHSKHVLTPEAESYLAAGSPEVQVFNAIPSEGGIPMATIKEQLGPVGELGFRQAMQLKWVAIDKSSGAPLVVRKMASVEDKAVEQLRAVVAAPEALTTADLAALGKRRMVSLLSWKTFAVSKGAKFQLERTRAATDLTQEMMAKGTWRDQPFKEYNFAALGLPYAGGALHPLLKVRTQFRKIFTQMGFEEMPTNNYVESSFWNFDALFQPQQHPARDAHDTFFLTSESFSFFFLLLLFFFFFSSMFSFLFFLDFLGLKE